MLPCIEKVANHGQAFKVLLKYSLWSWGILNYFIALQVLFQCPLKWQTFPQ